MSEHKHIYEYPNNINRAPYVYFCKCGKREPYSVLLKKPIGVSAKEMAKRWVNRQKYSMSAYAWRVEAYAAGYRAGKKA